MSLRGAKSPHKGSRWRNLDRIRLARTVFYSGLIAFFIYIFVVYTLGDRSREIEVTPSSHSSAEVIDAVEQYLKTTTHRGFRNQGEPGICWELFEDQQISVRYASSGSWQVDAWYDLIRYYWRVDDQSLEVTPDRWQQTTLPTVEC